MMEKTTFPISENNLIGSFDTIAETLFRNFQVIANKDVYRILEIEFYYNSEQNKDNQTYGVEKQKTNGEWYFHYSGIDITIGNGMACGGILLRSLGKLNETKTDFKCICGPLRVKNELLNNFGSIGYKVRFPYFKNIPDAFEYDESLNLQKTRRVGINKNKDNYESKFRYVLFENKFPSNYRRLKSDRN